MEDRYQKGLEIMTRLAGEPGKRALEGVAAFAPDFAKLIAEFGFGDIYSRPGLDSKQRELITLASLITQGASAQLPFHFSSALNIGFTKEELIEVIIHCTAYTGFPRALSALQVLQEVWIEREGQR